MPALVQKAIGCGALMLFVSAAALTAFAGPGDGAVVVIDKPGTPDVIIQELRPDNSDASHVPVRIRITVPKLAVGDADGTGLRGARLTAYLTSTTDPDTDRLREETVQLGPEWANRSVVMQVPAPGDGTYFMHVDAELRLDDGTVLEFLSTSTQGVSFGTALNCKDVETVEFLGAGGKACPVLFETGSTDLTPRKKPKFAGPNQKALDAAVESIEELCASGSLHRVSVHGWASTLPSFDPPNEELARGRADAAAANLRARVPACAAQIRDDSEPGTRAVTEQFGSGPGDHEPNQCAQIQITRHKCGN